MEGWWWLVCLCVAALTDRTQQNMTSCDSVRTLLLLQQIDATTGVLNSPGTGKRQIRLRIFSIERCSWTDRNSI